MFFKDFFELCENGSSKLVLTSY